MLNVNGLHISMKKSLITDSPPLSAIAPSLEYFQQFTCILNV